MDAKTILNRKGRTVHTVSPSATIREAMALLLRHSVGSLLVVDNDGEVLGIVSERDIVRAVAREGVAALSHTARDLMTAELVTVSPATSVAEGLAIMTQRRCRHLPVMEHGKLAGMVSIGDLVKARIEQAEQEAESLRAFVTAA